MGKKCIHGILDCSVCELNRQIFSRDPNTIGFYSKYRRYTADEALDWLVRGCPVGESEVIPGLLPKSTSGLKHSWSASDPSVMQDNFITGVV